MYGIGSKILDLIRERHLTISSVAEEADLARETLSGIVNGKQTPRRGTIEKIAKVLGIDPIVLISPTDGPGKRHSGGEVSGLRDYVKLAADLNVDIPVLLAKGSEIGEVMTLTEVLKIASKALKDGDISEDEYEGYVNLMVKLIKCNHV